MLSVIQLYGCGSACRRVWTGGAETATTSCCSAGGAAAAAAGLIADGDCAASDWWCGGMRDDDVDVVAETWLSTSDPLLQHQHHHRIHPSPQSRLEPNLQARLRIFALQARNVYWIFCYIHVAGCRCFAGWRHWCSTRLFISITWLRSVFSIAN